MSALIKLHVKSNIRLVQQSKEQLRKKVPTVARLRMYHAALELKKRMSVPPKDFPVRFPYVPWDTDAQRIKVIIKLKKAGNIPYKATHKSEKSFHLLKHDRGYSVQSTMRAIKYLYGDAQGNGQSNIHQGRRPLLRRQADIVIKALPKIVKANMIQIARNLPKTGAVT